MGKLKLESNVAQKYGNKLRVRVSGLIVRNDKLLMLKHSGLNRANIFWAPPGGGQKSGESCEAALKREFLEETGLVIIPQKFLFIHEYIEAPLHALELFFLAEVKNGTIQLGEDPEMGDKQILKALQWMHFDDIKKLPKDQKHNIFNILNEPEEILQASGYFQFGKN